MKKARLIILYGLSLFLSILPLGAYFIINHDKYVGAGGIKLLFGGIIIAFIMVLKTLKKLKMPSGVWFFGILFLLAYLMESVLADLKMLTFLALVGEIFDATVQLFIERAKRQLYEGRARDIVKDALEDRLSGRV